MKKFILYTALILFCCSLTYPSKSCNANLAALDIKKIRERAEIPDVEIHPLSIFTLRY